MTRYTYLLAAVASWMGTAIVLLALIHSTTAALLVLFGVGLYAVAFYTVYKAVGSATDDR